MKQNSHGEGVFLTIVPSRLMARIGSDEMSFAVLKWKNGEVSVPGLRPLGAAGTPRVVKFFREPLVP